MTSQGFPEHLDTARSFHRTFSAHPAPNRTVGRSGGVALPLYGHEVGVDKKYLRYSVAPYQLIKPDLSQLNLRPAYR